MRDTWYLMNIIHCYNKRVKTVLKYSKEYDGLQELYAQAIRLQCKQDYGHVMAIDDFIDEVSSGGFMDYDGSGVFIDFDGDRHEYIRCNVQWLMTHKNDYKYVLWFNK